jgi:hypothetical protein
MISATSTGGRGIYEVPEEPVLEANIAFSFASSSGPRFFRSCELYRTKPYVEQTSFYRK